MIGPASGRITTWPNQLKLVAISLVSVWFFPKPRDFMTDLWAHSDEFNVLPRCSCHGFNKNSKCLADKCLQKHATDDWIIVSWHSSRLFTSGYSLIRMLPVHDSSHSCALEFMICCTIYNRKPDNGICLKIIFWILNQTAFFWNFQNLWDKVHLYWIDFRSLIA